MKFKKRHLAVVATAAAIIGGTYALTANPTHVGSANLYPDPKLTPGLIATSDFGELTAHNPCGTYSQCHRNTTSAQKNEVCAEYPDNCLVSKEIDHFCPLALGCGDDIRNLWPEPETNMWNGENWGFHVKDQLEAFLAAQMKAGKIAPIDAQECILKDWVACYKQYISKSPQGPTNQHTFGSVSVEDPDNQ